MTRLLLYLFITISLQTFAQSEVLKGRILAEALQGYAINIVNYTKAIGTTNDEEGFFRLPAAVGDSIVFSSIQYETRSIVVSQNQLQKESVTVVLFPTLEQLEQVKISNIELSGYLDTDINVVELLPYVDNRILDLPFRDKPQPTQIERRIYTAKSGVLDLPINYLNGKLKKLKRIKAIEDLDKIVQKGEIAFNTPFFTQMLKIPKDLVSDFMYYCAEDDYFKNLLESSKRLTLLEFFKQKAIIYKIHKEID